MTVDQLREVLRAVPFQPFKLHLADGREIDVLHRDFVAIAPNGRTCIVYQQDSSFNIVDLLLVTDIEVRHPPNVKGKKGNKA